MKKLNNSEIKQVLGGAQPLGATQLVGSTIHGNGTTEVDTVYEYGLDGDSEPVHPADNTHVHIPNNLYK